MSNRVPAETDRLANARAIVRGMIRDVDEGRLLPDGGPAWLRLRAEALRYFVLTPVSSAARACLRALTRGASRDARDPAAGD